MLGWALQLPFVVIIDVLTGFAMKDCTLFEASPLKMSAGSDNLYTKILFYWNHSQELEDCEFFILCSYVSWKKKN